ncbi:flavodoxin domain-containing protein [Blastococcus atacamensis]|uniref:flavodoxin domain-containing protein n=1 Tax=Blastococcus atacamensis TaxID=2070508 RepID=UPI0018E4D6E7|nr:flavodoxin domain-containing protein [Blastococcus atacamensis]
MAVATRHGATREIADAIAAGMAGASEDTWTVDVRDAGDVADVRGYDAVVVGSAVYFGHWLEQAQSFVLRCAIDLWNRPVWAFSSGPLGIPPRPPEELLAIEEMLVHTRCREHRVFPGRLDRSLLGLRERAMVTALRAPEGDFRDLAVVGEWGAGIAGELADELSGAAE